MQIIIPKLEGVVAGATPSLAPTTATQPTATLAPSATVAPTATTKPTATLVPSATIVPTVTLSQGPTGPTGQQPGAPTPGGQASSASTDKQYTVVKGDSLWAISVKRYGNGYRWVEIARMNNLKNPNVIHPGNTLMMP
jgi:nucleoid-associated protein YgaU